jgi:hypothetical protein
VALSSLHHVIDLEWMKEAYRLTRKDGAPGLDGVTAADFFVTFGGKFVTRRNNRVEQRNPRSEPSCSEN